MASSSPKKTSFYGAVQQRQKPPPLQNNVNILSTFAAGLGSGFLASMVCAPLDLIRTRLQVWNNVVGPGSSTRPPSLHNIIREIVKQEGPQGMFRGLGATLVTVPLFWSVYFPLYDETKRYVRNHYPTTSPGLIHCGSAMTTGFVADVICNPLFVVRTRLQTQALHNLSRSPPGMIETAKELLRSSPEGVRVFWRGMTANVMGLSHVGVQFPAYEALKKIARDRKGAGTKQERQETTLELLLASGIAKMSASLLTYPHEVLRSRMMDDRQSSKAPTLRGTIVSIYRAEGFAGFYAGLPITLIRVVPNCCITFVSYELLLRGAKQYFTSSSPAIDGIEDSNNRQFNTQRRSTASAS